MNPNIFSRNHLAFEKHFVTTDKKVHAAKSQNCIARFEVRVLDEEPQQKVPLWALFLLRVPLRSGSLNAVAASRRRSIILASPWTAPSAQN